MSTITRVQTRNAGSSGTTITPGFSAAPAAGNLLLLSLSLYRSSGTTAPAVTADPTGWTKLGTGSVYDSANTVWNAGVLYYRWADGTEGTSTWSATTNAASYRYLIEEYSGFGGSAGTAPDATSSVVGFTTPTVTATNSLTTSKTNTWVYSLVTTRGSSSSTATWGGGSTKMTDATNTNGMNTGVQNVAAGGTAVSPSVTLASHNASNLMSVAFATSDSASGGGATTTGYAKVWDGSSWVRRPVKVWDGTAWTRRPVKFRASDGTWRQSNS